MIATISDNKFIFLEQVTQGIEEELVNWFSVREPNARFLDNDLWDGWYRRYNVSKQRLALPFLDELKRCCETKKIPLEIVDRRDAPKYPAPQKEQITKTLIEGITLEQYQVRALQVSCDQEIGLHSAKTGAGKTEVMAALVKMFRCPTLIVTEQIVVLEQIVDRLKIRKVVHRNDIGMFCYGHMPDNNAVIVGSIQSISTPKEPKRSDISLKGGTILKRTLNWINQARAKSGVNGPPSDIEFGLILCECGRTFKSKGGLTLHKKKCSGEIDTEIDHLLQALPEPIVNKLIDDEAYLDKMDKRYMQILVDYHNALEWESRKKWYKTRYKKAKAIQKLVKTCDLLLVDEADLATNQQYARLFKFYFQGRRRYGFSGTPFDPSEPVRGMLLREHLGNIISEAKRQEVEAAGRIVPIDYYMIAVGAKGDKFDARAFDIAEKEEIIENEKFHRLIANIVKAYPGDGTMILLATSPLESLGKALEEVIPDSKFIFGKTPKSKRQKYIELFESRKMTCLIGSLILKRGLDLDGGVENLIIVGGGGKWSEYNQKVGRAVRLNKKGRARVFGFFFLNNKYLYKHSRANLKAIVDMGYPSKVIINGKTIDGKKLIKSRFRIPRGI